MRFLITCCLGDQMRENVTDLRNAFPDAYIVGVDMRNMLGNYIRLDGFHQVHACTDPMYVDEIIAVCNKEKIDMILSFSSFDIEPFKKNLDRIPCKVCLTLDDGLVIANGKDSFYEFAKKNGIQIPLSSDVMHDSSELKAFMEQHGMKKVITKKLLSTGAKGMREYVFEEVDKECGHSEEGFIAQEVLDGTEYSVDVFCKHGEILFSCVKKHSMMDLGITIYSEIVDEKEVAEICEDACKALRLDGLVGFDVKKNADGVPFIIDSNPRGTGTISLTAKAGVNLLQHLVEYYQTGDTDFSGEQLDYGMKIARYRKDYYFKSEEELWNMLK